MLAQYRFEKYKKAQDAAGPRVLLTSDPARIDEAVRLAEAVGLVRDLVNTPAGDLGPAELALAAEEALKPFRPALTIHSGGERSEEHTSELQSLMRTSYAVFCLKKKQP